MLTIGTAVDSNVLIYERIREEAHAGPLDRLRDPGRLRPRLRDDHRFQLRRWRSRPLILFFLGSGPVRGFAVVFILGILTTVITAVTMTRMMIALWYRWARPKALPF